MRGIYEYVYYYWYRRFIRWIFRLPPPPTLTPQGITKATLEILEQNIASGTVRYGDAKPIGSCFTIRYPTNNGRPIQ